VKVYVVQSGTCAEDTQIDGIYSSLELAQEGRTAHKTKGWSVSPSGDFWDNNREGYSSLWITAWELDKP
jgi:hypothetical protein